MDPMLHPHLAESVRYSALRVRGSIVTLSSPESLRKLEQALGIAEKRFVIPSLLGRPSLSVPLLYIILLVVLVYLGGPRAVLPLVALGYFLVTSNTSRD